MIVVKRDGTKENFNIDKIQRAINLAFKATGKSVPEYLIKMVDSLFAQIDGDTIGVEEIQDKIENILMNDKFFDVAKAYILYRHTHAESRLIKERVEYITKYSNSRENAAANSNTDANANNSCKNVSSIEAEVFKDKNRLIQRMFMKNKLHEMFPEVENSYLEDITHHIIYSHDEGSSPIQKSYCGAYVLYPLMLEGVGNVDNITPSAPNDMQSFSGQVTNLVFALSAQSKGAVALGDYFVTLNYYIIQEFGSQWYNKIDEIFVNNNVRDYCKYTIRREIKKSMKQFIYGVNQPQGNRGFQSPFTNLSIYDKFYYEALFNGYAYPDGTKPEWKAIDNLQRIFIALLRELRAIKPLTFPVLTIALLYDENGYKDKEYADLCAEEWSLGSSHFLYNSSNPESLSSCCRVQNKLTENYFTSTTGMIGLMTGSCNVITLNINRIVQNWAKWLCYETEANVYMASFMKNNWHRNNVNENLYDSSNGLKKYLVEILKRVYKYHIAYKTMLYELEDKGMITFSNAGYLYIKKLYSTIGVIGYYEAAKFLGLKDNSKEYKEFINFIMKTISDTNAEHSIYDKERPFIFNLEAIPGENLAVKLYHWDEQDEYFVPSDQNLYNCYFFNPWKEGLSVIDKLKLHGREVCKSLGGGQAAHINLDTHATKRQYLLLMDVARKVGCNYFTFNIPMSECKKCGHVVNGPVTECPKCHSKEIKYWTRIIGFLTAVDNWSPGRQKEFYMRIFGHNLGLEQWEIKQKTLNK